MSDEEWKTYPYILINVSLTISVEPEEKQILEVLSGNQELNVIQREWGVGENQV